jgi:organic hydroperoxide reductase OsmC/OhrA
MVASAATAPEVVSVDDGQRSTTPRCEQAMRNRQRRSERWRDADLVCPYSNAMRGNIDGALIVNSVPLKG